MKVGDLVLWHPYAQRRDVGIIAQLDVVKEQPDLCAACHSVLIEGMKMIISVEELKIISESR